jgi:hypothetical protein
MARITSPLLEWTTLARGMLSQRREWRLFDDLWFGLEGPFGPSWIVIKRGTVTDLASVPWPISMLIRNDAVPPAAPIVHDLLYKTRGHVLVIRWDGASGSRIPLIRNPFTRLEADQIFQTILIETGVPKWKAALLYAGVRLGGWKGWGS